MCSPLVTCSLSSLQSQTLSPQSPLRLGVCRPSPTLQDEEGAQSECNSMLILLFIFLPMGFWCQMSHFSALQPLFALDSVLCSTGEVSDKLTGRLPRLTSLRFSITGSRLRSRNMPAKLWCLVATSRRRRHCFGTGLQTLLSSQLCAV